MIVSDFSWYNARSYNGVSEVTLYGDPFRKFDSADDVRKALADHVRIWHTEDRTYLICKVTYRTTNTDDGKFVKLEKHIEAVDEFKMEVKA